MTAPLSETRRAEIEAGRHQPRSVAEVDTQIDELTAEVDRVQRAYTFDTAELKRRVSELESERHETNEVLDEVVRALRTKQGAALDEAANELEQQFTATGDRLIHRTKLLGLLREWAAARTGGGDQ